jgi:hypothetical protein
MQVDCSVLSVQPQVGVRRDSNLGHGAVQVVDEILDGVCRCEGIEVSIR